MRWVRLAIELRPALLIIGIAAADEAYGDTLEAGLKFTRIPGVT